MSRATTTRTVGDQITTLLTRFTLTTAAREMVSRFVQADQQPAQVTSGGKPGGVGIGASPAVREPVGCQDRQARHREAGRRLGNAHLPALRIAWSVSMSARSGSETMWATTKLRPPMRHRAQPRGRRVTSSASASLRPMRSRVAARSAWA